MNTLHKTVANPSGFDSYSNYIGETPNEELLVVLTRNRDSDCLTESNWQCALEELGGESETVEIHRFGHWACGWWEALCVKAGSEAEKIGAEIESSLSDYPVLNDEHFSEKEQDEANRIWQSCYDEKERIEYIRDNRSQFDFWSFSDLLQCVRGKFFSGYASELIH
jgi:hypothetical protein